MRRRELAPLQVRVVLKAAPELDLADWYLAAGGEAAEGVKGHDLVYLGPALEPRWAARWARPKVVPR